ncbi:MAG: DUF3450 domain-containing protein [Pseudomonadales bacterium]|nr:DUF3450 domain-containing protein [Pseudomonadales bacterium]
MNQLKQAWQKSIVCTAALMLAVQVSAATMDNAIKSGENRAKNAQTQQRKIDNVDGQTKTLEQEYRAVVKEVEGLDVYLQQLNKQLNAQQAELTQIDQSIKQVTLIERQITPLMLNMIAALETFVQNDIPFQAELRQGRIVTLQEIMGRSDVSVAEKYRKVMDAYQKEMDYGRTIKTYRASMSLDGAEREVDFLRVGRVALMYQTLDGQTIGIWNNTSRQFEPLASEYKSKLTTALRIAREQAAPDLIKVPVAAPVAVN